MPVLPNAKTVRQKKTTPAASTQLHLKIAEIRDNVLVLKNGGMRAILQTSSVNFNLKSEPEQQSIIISYQGFLNTLEFPIQIVVRSKKLDIQKYLENLEVVAEKQMNPLLKKETFEYKEYIKKLVEYADIMEKLFYVVVPYDPFGSKKTSIITQFIDFITPRDSISKIKQRRLEFDTLKKNLSGRVNSVTAGLQSCGLRVNQLSTSEIVELFYNIYNPLTSRNQKITNLDDISVV